MIELKSSWVKGILVAGIIAVSIVAMVIDFTAGKDIAMIGIGGLIGLSRGE